MEVKLEEELPDGLLFPGDLTTSLAEASSSKSSSQTTRATSPFSIDSPLTTPPSSPPTSPSRSFSDLLTSIKSEQTDLKPDTKLDVKTISSDPRSKVVKLFPHGLPPVTTTINHYYADLFFRFCAERHSMWEKRSRGIPREGCTEDETFRKSAVGNLFRELDKGSNNFKENVVDVGEQTHEEICFRIFLYCGFYNDDTWHAFLKGLGEVPSWKKWSLTALEDILYQRSFVERKKIYYGGFQQVPPVKYFGMNLPHYSATLRFVQSLMEMNLPQQLLGLDYAVDASSIIQTIPTMGGFLSLCLIVNLNESPTMRFRYRNFATCGPGSRGFLKRIFGSSTINCVAHEQAALVWLFENQWKYWSNIGIDPPHAYPLGVRPGMRVLDIENSLCWCHRYYNEYTSKGYRGIPNLPPIVDLEKDVDTPAWCEEERYVEASSKAAWRNDPEEIQEQLGEVKEEEGEEIFEVEKIVCRKGPRDDRDGCFRVRWKGWMPEDDTWERASSLKEGAQEALDDWIEWENRVFSTLTRIAKDYPYDGKPFTSSHIPPKPVTREGTPRPKRKVTTKKRRIWDDDVTDAEEDEEEDEDGWFEVGEVKTPSKSSTPRKKHQPRSVGASGKKIPSPTSRRRSSSTMVKSKPSNGPSSQCQAASISLSKTNPTSRNQSALETDVSLASDTVKLEQSSSVDMDVMEDNTRSDQSSSLYTGVKMEVVNIDSLNLETSISGGIILDDDDDLEGLVDD